MNRFTQVIVVTVAEEDFRASEAQRSEILAYRYEQERKLADGFVVAEAHDADVLGNSNTSFIERPYHAQGHEVKGHEDSIEQVLLDYPNTCVMTALTRLIAEDGFQSRESTIQQFLPPALQPGATI